MEHQKTSGYRKTAAVLFIVALAIAVPITLNFLGHQQDIRQRASDDRNVTKVSPCAPYGDLNLDNVIDRNDYNILKDIVDINEEGDTRRQKIRTRADLNNDGQLTTDDLSLLAKYLRGTLDTFPVCSTPTISPTQPALTPTGQNGSPTPPLTPTPSGTPSGTRAFDLNDDGKVDELDLNILYAGFAKRVGD